MAILTNGFAQIHCGKYDVAYVSLRYVFSDIFNKYNNILAYIFKNLINCIR